METFGGRVEAAVEDDRSFGEPRGQGFAVSCVMDEPAGLEVGKNVHNDSVPSHRVKSGELLPVSGLPRQHLRRFCTVQGEEDAVLRCQRKAVQRGVRRPSSAGSNCFGVVLVGSTWSWERRALR